VPFWEILPFGKKEINLKKKNEPLLTPQSVNKELNPVKKINSPIFLPY